MVADFNRLWTKVRTAKNEGEAARSLARILTSEEGRTFVLGLEQTDAVLCIETINRALVKNNLPQSERWAFFGTLSELVETHARLPSSLIITGKVDIPNFGQPCISGGFADVKQGHHKGCAVAIKTTRIQETDDLGEIRKRFFREVVTWNSLSHPNVLRLIGVLDGFGDHLFATVSEWMVHGNIMEYIRENAINRLELLYGASKGLKYLHDSGFVHGDLKGANILVTNDVPPTACLADFGFTTKVLDSQFPMESSQVLQGGTVAFMAPELIVPAQYNLEGLVHTRETDIYAFSLVVLQVLTGELPFRDFTQKELAYYVSLGSRPPKPGNAKDIGISDSLWALILRCWDEKIAQRPQILEVVQGVGDAAADWHADMPPAGGADQWEDSLVYEESDELKHIGIFQPYSSEYPPASSSAGASRPNDASTVGTQKTLVETSDGSYEFVCKDLGQDSFLPSTVIFPKKRSRFGCFLKISAMCDFGHTYGY